MAGGLTAAILDGDTHVLPVHALELLSTLSPTSLEALATAAVSEMAKNGANSGQDTLEQLPPEQYEAFAVVCSIVATCARDGGSRTSAEARQQLYALGVEDDALQLKLLPVLAAVVPSVERVLANTSFDFAHVVDVNWRLDYVLRSSSAGSVHEPLYFVQLKIQPPNANDSKLQTVTFTCSVEELRALVYKIQEAVNEVEKLAARAPSQLRANG